MTSIMSDIADKEAISERIEQSVVPETRARGTLGIHNKLQSTRKRCERLAYKARDIEERSELQRGEQDKKKGRKE